MDSPMMVPAATPPKTPAAMPQPPAFAVCTWLPARVRIVRAKIIFFISSLSQLIYCRFKKYDSAALFFIQQWVSPITPRCYDETFHPAFTPATRPPQASQVLQGFDAFQGLQSADFFSRDGLEGFFD